jgi:hypothetical protein
MLKLMTNIPKKYTLSNINNIPNGDVHLYLDELIYWT